MVELVAGGCHVILDGHRFAAADDLDQVVGAGEDAVPVVLGDMAQVLRKKRGGAPGGQRGGEGGNGDRLVADRDAQRQLDFLRDGVVIEFLGADERVDLAVVRIGILQDGGDDVGLVAAPRWGRGGRRRTEAEARLRFRRVPRTS